MQNYLSVPMEFSSFSILGKIGNYFLGFRKWDSNIFPVIPMGFTQSL